MRPIIPHAAAGAIAIVLVLLVAGCAGSPSPRVTPAPSGGVNWNQLTRTPDVGLHTLPPQGPAQTAVTTMTRADLEASLRAECRNFVAASHEPIAWARQFDPKTNKMVVTTAPPETVDQCVASLMKSLSAPGSGCVMPAPGEPVPDCMRLDQP